MKSRPALNARSVLRWDENVRPVLLLTALFVPIFGCQTKEAAAPPGPILVKVAAVVQQDIPVYSEWVAQLNGDTNAQIMPKVQGYVLRQNYKEGFFVNTGQLLFEIDPRPFQASLDQAQAQLAVRRADLSKTETDRLRDTPLAAQNAIPQKQLDNDLAAEAAAKAQVAAATAMVEQAQLNLAWTKVYSPIDGIAGVAKAQVGDLVGPISVMTTISKVDPIRAYFSISENSYLDAATRISQIVAGKSTTGGADVEFIQTNEVPYPSQGRIILVNREVSSQTGTIQVAAAFPNPKAILRPGGFGRVRIRTGENKGALLIPEAAVIEVQSAYQVVVIGSDNKAMFRAIKVGDRVGSNRLVTEGLNAGERVVVEGFMKLRDGVTVAAESYAPTGSAGGR